MRLAGTCSRYSKSAMPQLANAATYHGRDDKLRRWAYQANVMKTFEAMRRETVTRIVRIDADGNARVRRQRSHAASPHRRRIGCLKRHAENESADGNADFCFVQYPDDGVLQTREE